MHATAEIQVVPLGVGVSVRDQVMQAHQIIADSGLTVEAHAFGTNVEGELSRILEVIQRIHETLHADGVPRLSTAVKIGTRTDKTQTLASKRLRLDTGSGQ
jgi:uncharacterized protein (TIGR00106 family)